MTDVVRSPEYLIDRILPSNEVHLLGGPSGAGKTTWLFQVLKNEWKVGGTILGRDVHPVPFVYIAADRSKRGIERTMWRAGVDPSSVEFLSLLGRPEVNSITDVISMISRGRPLTRLLIIDGVMRLLPRRKDNLGDGGFRHISQFLAELCKLCVDRDLTIILVVHSPKQKEDSRYANPRERVMGSAAWAAFSETIILVEPLMPIKRESSNCRTLICLPRNDAPTFLDLEFSTAGKLVERNEELDSTLIEHFVSRIEFESTFTTSQFERAMGGSMSRATIYRWLGRLESQGIITKISHGVWRRNRPV